MELSRASRSFPRAVGDSPGLLEPSRAYCRSVNARLSGHELDPALGATSICLLYTSPSPRD
eukprot:11920737-Alexandrium_andersonii.AAC.1